MNAQSNEGSNGAPRRRWKPNRRVALAVAGAALAAAAFATWGPIGLGNGPLSAEVNVTVGWPDTARNPVGFVIPIHNSGSAAVVVDGVELIGGTRYDKPHLLALRILTAGKCGGTWPARQTAQGFVMSGCGGADAGPLIGHPIGSTKPKSFGFPGAAEVAAPRPGSCWVMTKIVVHYHVGIRSYTATNRYQLAVCTDNALVNSATTAAEYAS